MIKMENSHRSLSLFLVFFSCFLSFSQGYDFYVGGKQGWVLHPSEDYNQWAGRNRFLINDNLIFKYKKGADSVLLVNKDDYNSCNTKNPIQKMDNGNSVFKFEHSGPFYFISGEDDKCKQGQKLVVVVLRIRSGAMPPKLPPGPVAKPPVGPKPTAPAPGVSPGAYPPSTSSSSPVGTPSSHSPVAKPPSTSSPGPSGSPGTFPAPGMSPVSHTPVAKPPSTSSPAPVGSPSTFPVAKPPSTSSSPSSGSPGTSPSSFAPAVPPGSLSQPPLAETPEAASPPASTSAPALTPGSSLSPTGSPAQGSSPAGSQSPSGQVTGAPVSPNSSASVVHSSMMALAVSIILSLMVRI